MESSVAEKTPVVVAAMAKENEEAGKALMEKAPIIEDETMNFDFSWDSLIAGEASSRDQIKATGIFLSLFSFYCFVSCLVLL